MNLEIENSVYCDFVKSKRNVCVYNILYGTKCTTAKVIFTRKKNNMV